VQSRKNLIRAHIVALVLDTEGTYYLYIYHPLI
jgi:hypothetical protein